jgi:hypothetical protein
MGGCAPILFVIEVLLFLIPAVLLLDRHGRTRPTRLFWSALAVVAAGALYRFNAFMLTYDPGTGWHYFPAVGELFITLGIVAIEVMAYLFFVKRLPIMTAERLNRSTWNAGPRNQHEALGPYEASLIGTPILDEERPLEVLRTLHSFDPCLACAVHLHDNQGAPLVTVRVL